MDEQTVSDRIVHDVAVLTSDSLTGREAGTEGERKTINYLRLQFEAIGIQPKGSQADSYYQQFSDMEVVYHKSTSLKVHNIRYQYRMDFSVAALSRNGNGSGRLIDGLQGLVIPEKGIDQLSNLGDLKGKFVLIDLHVDDPLINDTSIIGKLTPRYRMMTALSKGAYGVIFWNQDSPWFGDLFNFRSADTLPGFALYVNQPTLKRLKRQTGTLIEVNVQIERKTCTYNNVIGFIDNHALRTIVIGAHFDHLGLKKDGRIFYGADDNASGTAGVLELARYLNTHRDTLNNYLFIGFSAEEKGLLGSDYFVKHPTVPISTVRFMLNLDMIGRLGCEGNIMEIEGSGSSSAWKRVLDDTPHPAFRIKRINAALPFSDHDPFYQAGIPVLFFNTGLHDDYHTVTDKATTLNYDGMVEILRFAEDFVVDSNQVPVIPYCKVPFMSQATAWVEFLFQALGWALTFN